MDKNDSLLELTSCPLYARYMSYKYATLDT